MDDIIFDIYEALSEKGYRDVKTFVNQEGNRVLTLETREGTVLVSAELLNNKGEQ